MSISLDEVIENLYTKQVPVLKYKEGDKLKFYLGANDLVYVPTSQELINPDLVDFKNLRIDQIRRIYKMVKSSKTDCYFLPVTVAQVIIKKIEFGSQNCTQKDDAENMIKQICWKLKVNRLGEITDVKR